MSASDLWRQSSIDRFVIWLPLREGMSFEAAARRAHQVVLAAHQGIGDCVASADTQLTLELNPAARWRLYGDSVESVSEALRRIETRDIETRDVGTRDMALNSDVTLDTQAGTGAGGGRD